MMTKQEIRAELKQRRNAIPPAEKQQADREIISRIAESRVFLEASALLLYAPHGSEIDLLPLARIARSRGMPIAFPRCDTETQTMQFYILEPHERLTEGAYGIPEPPASAKLCPLDAHTLCILPGLTFDPKGGRLGYGKGYYDRFLADFPGVTVGAVYARLTVEEVPTEPHDRPVQMLFTEQESIRCTEIMESDGNAPMPSDSKEAPRMEKKALLRTLTSGLHAPPILAVSTFLLLLLSRLFDTQLTNRENEYVVVILLQLLIFLIPAIIYGKLRGDAFPARMRMRSIERRHLWFVFCTAVVMISGSLLLCILTGGIESLTGNFTLYDTFVARINNSSPLETLYVLLAYCLLPAFCEELVYRSFLCAEYERYGSAVAIAASAFFFAMLHFSFPLFPAYLFLGAVLAAAMYATRSFFTVFLLHALYNLFCLFGQPYLSAFYVTAGSNEIFVFCLVTVCLLFAAFAVGEARKIYHRYACSNVDSSYTVPLPLKQIPKRLLSSLLSPAVAVALLIFLLVASVGIN